MNPLFVAADAVQELCRERDWGFCFIGGLAVLRWGEPRLTRDIDLTILAGFGAEDVVVDGLLARFEARIDDARQFALRNRVTLLRSDTGVPIDVALGALDFEQRSVERASLWDVKEAQRTAVPGGSGWRPPTPACRNGLHISQQPQQIRPGLPAGFHPAEPARDPRERRLEVLQPLLRPLGSA